jgi:hypothetical protein
VAGKNCKIFGGNDVAAKNYFISGGYFCKTIENSIAAENITGLFSVVIFA